MELHERLRIFFERLRAAPPARDAEEAMALVCSVLEKVEDEFWLDPARGATAV